MSGKALTFTCLLKDVIKDTDEQIHRSGEGPKFGSFSLCRVWVHHPLSTWMCLPTRELSEPCASGIFMEASSHRHDQIV